jgi:ketosteroid isomerase-like protein
MSQENVEIVRAAIDALDRGDLAVALRDVTRDFEFDFSRSIGTRPGVYALNGAQSFWEDFTGAWESVHLAADEFIDADEHVITPLTNSVRGRDGIEVQARTTWVWAFRDGRVARITFYQNRQEALEAARLNE